LAHVVARAGQESDKVSKIAPVPSAGAGKLVGLLPHLQWAIAEPEMQVHLLESKVQFFYELQ
jgi:fumarylacetoacetate (FAA) hydrolase family protein